jgi:hypothetical protein
MDLNVSDGVIPVCVLDSAELYLCPLPQLILYVTGPTMGYT